MSIAFLLQHAIKFDGFLPLLLASFRHRWQVLLLLLVLVSTCLLELGVTLLNCSIDAEAVITLLLLPW